MKKRPVFWIGFCLNFLVFSLFPGIGLLRSIGVTDQVLHEIVATDSRLHEMGAGYKLQIISSSLVPISVVSWVMLYGAVFLCWAVLYWNLKKISASWFERAGVFVLFLVSLEAYLAIPSRYWGPNVLKHDDGIGTAILVLFLQPFSFLVVFSVLGLMQRKFPKVVAGVCGLLVVAATLDYGSLALVLAKRLNNIYESKKGIAYEKSIMPKRKLAQEKCLGHRAGTGAIIYNGTTEAQIWREKNSDIRLFSREECEELQGNWHPTGECLKKEGGSLSWDLRGLNQICK